MERRTNAADTIVSISVVVVDDQEMVRDGLIAMLASVPDIEVVGEASDGLAAVARTTETRPDVVVMDIRMPGMDGLSAAERIVNDPLLTSKVLILTTFDLDEYVYRALRLGVSGFLLKDAPFQTLLTGVRVVAAGEALLAPSVTRRLVADFARRRTHERPNMVLLKQLSEREREVLTLIARGLSNAEIAAELFLAEQTVKSHVGRVLAKLQLRDRVQAVVLAYESGLLR